MVNAPPTSTHTHTQGQEDEEEEEEDEFGGQETLVTAPPQHAEHEFTQDNTMVIREDLQPGVRVGGGMGWERGVGTLIRCVYCEGKWVLCILR